MHKLTDVTGIVVSIFGVGALLAGLILTGQHGSKGEIHGMKGDIAGLQQRTARIEGQLSLLLEAWNIDQPGPPTVAGK